MDRFTLRRQSARSVRTREASDPAVGVCADHDAGRNSGAAAGKLDDLLGSYFDHTFSNWQAPTDLAPAGDGVCELTDRKILAALREAPAPRLPDQRLRYGVAAVAAVAASVAAVVVALTTLGGSEPAMPADSVLLTAATAGGDRGVFADQAALDRCLQAARIPAGQRVVIGAGPVTVRGTDATALLLPGPSLGSLRVLAVSPACAEGSAGAVLASRNLTAGAHPAARATTTAIASTP